MLKDNTAVFRQFSRRRYYEGRGCKHRAAIQVLTQKQKFWPSSPPAQKQTKDKKTTQNKQDMMT